MAKLGALNELRNIIGLTKSLPKGRVLPAVKYNNDIFVARQHSDALGRLVTKYPDVDDSRLDGSTGPNLGYYSPLKDVFLPLEDGKKYDPRWAKQKQQRGEPAPLDEITIPDNLYER